MKKHYKAGERIDVKGVDAIDVVSIKPGGIVLVEFVDDQGPVRIAPKTRGRARRTANLIANPKAGK